MFIPSNSGATVSKEGRVVWWRMIRFALAMELDSQFDVFFFVGTLHGRLPCRVNTDVHCFCRSSTKRHTSTLPVRGDGVFSMPSNPSWASMVTASPGWRNGCGQFRSDCRSGVHRAPMRTVPHRSRRPVRIRGRKFIRDWNHGPSWRNEVD